MRFRWSKALWKGLQWAVVTAVGGAAAVFQAAPQGELPDPQAMGYAGAAAVLAGAGKILQNWQKHR